MDSDGAAFEPVLRTCFAGLPCPHVPGRPPVGYRGHHVAGKHVTVTEPGHLVGSVPRIPGEYECPIREPDQEHAQQPAHDSGRCAVWPVPLLVVLFGSVQIDEYRQRPRAGGERELDEGGENDPLVPYRHAV